MFKLLAASGIANVTALAVDVVQYQQYALEFLKTQLSSLPVKRSCLSHMMVSTQEKGHTFYYYAIKIFQRQTESKKEKERNKPGLG